MDIYDEIENLTKGLPPDQKILEANRLKNIYCNIGYMDTESQRLRKLRSHGLTTTLNAELNIAPDGDITLTQQFLDNFPANYSRYMEAYKHSIRLLSDLQQLYAIIVVNMNRGESYLFKGNDQISNFFSIFKDRLYPQLHPLDRTSNYLFLYCSNDVDIFIAKKALNLCSIHQVTPIDMALIQRIQNAQKTVEKRDATQSSQTLINRPPDESGKNDRKSTELPIVTTTSSSMIKESNKIDNLNLKPAMGSGREPSPPGSGSHSHPRSSPRHDIFSLDTTFQGTSQPTHLSTDQTILYSLQTTADRPSQQSSSRPSTSHTVHHKKPISDPVPTESVPRTEESSTPIKQPGLSTSKDDTRKLSFLSTPDIPPIPDLKMNRRRESEPPKESDDMELTLISAFQQNRKAPEQQEKELRAERLKAAEERRKQQEKKILEDQIGATLLKEVDKSVDKIEKELREAREQQKQKEKEKRLRAVDRRMKQTKTLKDTLETRRERQKQQSKKLKEKQLNKTREQTEKELKEKQLREAQEQQKRQEEKLREQQEREGRELTEKLLKEIESRKAQEQEKQLREAREQQEKELAEARKREKEELRKVQEQQEKEVLPQTPTRKLEFTPPPSPTPEREEELPEPDISPIKSTDASKEHIKEPEFQTQTPSPSTTKKVVEEIQEIQGAKKPVKESEQITSPTSAEKSLKRLRLKERFDRRTPKRRFASLSPKERFDKLSVIASSPPDYDVIIPYVDDIPTQQEKAVAEYILSSRLNKEEIPKLTGKIFNVSDDDRGKLINLFKNFQKENRTAEDQMNFILRNHLGRDPNLNVLLDFADSFFDFAANYTIYTGIPILDLEDNENYEMLKKDTRYTQEACNYVADVLSRIRSIIIAGKIGDIKIRKTNRETKTQITRGIEKTIDRLRRIAKTRKKGKWNF